MTFNNIVKYIKKNKFIFLIIIIIIITLYLPKIEEFSTSTNYNKILDDKITEFQNKITTLEAKKATMHPSSFNNDYTRILREIQYEHDNIAYIHELKNNGGSREECPKGGVLSNDKTSCKFDKIDKYAFDDKNGKYFYPMEAVEFRTQLCKEGDAIKENETCLLGYDKDLYAYEEALSYKSNIKKTEPEIEKTQIPKSDTTTIKEQIDLLPDNINLTNEQLTQLKIIGPIILGVIILLIMRLTR
jgi:hypothetical protein